jgi:RNA recognition motif-containing protein
MDTLLIVDGLPLDFTVKQLHALFEPFGIVNSTKVVRDPLGRSLSFGYVEMASEAGAEDARQALDGTKLQDRTIRVAISSLHGAA